MSRRTRCLLGTMLLLGTIGAVACGDPPTREMDQAQGALDAARAAGAERYAAEEYKAAADALKGAQDAVAQRDYRLALNHALDSRERAQNAAKQSAEQQAAQRSGAERRLSEVTAMLAMATQRLTAAEAAHLPRRALAPPHASIAVAQTYLQKASTLIASGDFAESQKQMAEASSQLGAAMGQLSTLTAGRGARQKR